MKLSDIGEFGLINHISKYFNYNIDDIKGIGDDCAIIKNDNNNAWIITTDMLIEDIHFLINKISPFELGYKSLAVNLSDIAAMGGIPHSFFISIGIPKKISDAEWIEEFYKGLKNLSDRFNTFLLGGDTTKSPDKFVISITVIGRVEISKVKTRNGAKPGDLICLTDYVGDSSAGLKVILEDLKIDNTTKYLITKHNVPDPQIEIGMFLSEYHCVHAMMDVSDGIESDIQRIMEQSNVGAEISVEKLPFSDNLKMFCKEYNLNPFEFGLFGGEDYCLLFTVDASESEKLNRTFYEKFGKYPYVVGKITEKTGVLELKYYDQKFDIKGHGFDHFKV